jgi:hypothetical protein
VSSLNNNSIHKIHALIGKLADKKKRAEIAIEVAKNIGAEELIIFISDPDLHVLLPAEGFLQTLPGADTWNKFLRSCVKDTLHTGTLPYPSSSTVKSATGIAYEDKCVLVFLGGKPNINNVQQVSSVMPL